MNWQQQAVVYQIYPRSFQDSNGDGFGDIQGIIQRLDYLQDLGVTVLWISPVYDSPNDDNGYDIRDYQAIMTEFGTMQDFDELLEAAHGRNLKIILDMVVNHTSDEHVWFKTAKQNPSSPEHDYYIWRSGINGQPPNNWQAAFQGSAWDQATPGGDYYLHLFSPKQPDLNWENPKLRLEIYQMLRWWLDKGVDGFRLDVINLISKDQNFPEGTPIPDGTRTNGSSFFMNGPRIHEFLQELNQEVFAKYDILTVGEAPGVSPEQAILYTKPERHELDMVFQFEHVSIGDGPQGKWNDYPWTLPELKRILNRWQVGLEHEGWNSLYWDNHDQPRAVSRFGNDQEFRLESAKLLATTLFCMKGTPYIYQGEELGMTNVKFADISHYRDIETLNAFKELTTVYGWTTQQTMNAIYARGRDNARTPMHWDDSQNAGFGGGTPWLEMNPNYPSINAKNAIADPNSVFHHYQKLIALRASEPVIHAGSFQMLDLEHSSIFAYLREVGSTRLLVISNFSPQLTTYSIPSEFCQQGAQILSNNYPEVIRLEPAVTLKPYQSLVVKTQKEVR